MCVCVDMVQTGIQIMMCDFLFSHARTHMDTDIRIGRGRAQSRMRVTDNGEQIRSGQSRAGQGRDEEQIIEQESTDGGNVGNDDDGDDDSILSVFLNLVLSFSICFIHANGRRVHKIFHHNIFHLNFVFWFDEENKDFRKMTTIEARHTKKLKGK